MAKRTHKRSTGVLVACTPDERQKIEDLAWLLRKDMSQLIRDLVAEKSDQLNTEEELKKHLRNI